MRSISFVGPLLLVLACDAQGPRDARPRREPTTRVEPDPAPPIASGEPEVIPVATGVPRSFAALDPQERERYLAALDEGRRLHRAGDYEGAMAAMDRVLDVVPDDPRALGERGWAALFAGKLDEADDALRRAEAGASDDVGLLASILYNRGRLAEQQERPEEAVALYQRSLRLRPHPATYRHLVALPGGTRYVFGPQVHPLQGPYERIGALCAEERRLAAGRPGKGEGHEPACIPDAADGLGGAAVEVPAKGELGAPWTGLRFVETRPDPYTARFHAALRTSEGWFVVPDVASLSRGMPETTERVTRLGARVEELVPGGAPQVVLEVETSWDELEGDGETHRVELLCGVGPSGAPSCTGALPRSTEVRRRGEAPVRWSVRRRVTPAGMLVLEGERAELDEPAAALLGEHSLVFP